MRPLKIAAIEILHSGLAASPVIWSRVPTHPRSAELICRDPRVDHDRMHGSAADSARCQVPAVTLRAVEKPDDSGCRELAFAGHESVGVGGCVGDFVPSRVREVVIIGCHGS